MIKLTKTRLWLFLLACCLMLGQVVGQDRKPNGSEKSKVDASDDWRSHKLYLITIKNPKDRTKEEVKDEKLLKNRIYIRYEPRFFTIDPATKRREQKGEYGIDFTDYKAKFLDEPRRLLRVGSVIPGTWVGDDTPGANYVFTSKNVRVLDKFERTNEGVRYTVFNFYKDGTTEEETFAPNATEVP